MAQLIKVTKNFQITLPSKLREQIPLAEGDYLEAGVEGKSFVFRPKRIADRDMEQEWYWSPAWQGKEREAEEDLKNGRVVRHKNMASFIRELKALS